MRTLSEQDLVPDLASTDPVLPISLDPRLVLDRLPLAKAILQQETGPAVARRLLVAAMACVTVWHLQADESVEAQELKSVLIRLSGRQTKRSRPHTAPALLAGL